VSCSYHSRAPKLTQSPFSVSSRFVLTAAHCLHPKGQSRKREAASHVIVGAHILDIPESTEQRLFVSLFIIHRDWDTTDGTRYDADIALIKLKDQVRYTKFSRPICLPSASEAEKDLTHQNGVVAGWGEYFWCVVWTRHKSFFAIAGKTDYAEVSTSEPNIIKLPIVSEGTCLRHDEFFIHTSSPRTFCAGGLDGRGPW